MRAQHFDDLEEFRAAKQAGSFHIARHGDGELSFWYCCPCGCGSCAPILAGDGYKPEGKPTWKWNGSIDRPTLTPSVNHIGHWHGWLTNGEWKSV